MQHLLFNILEDKHIEWYQNNNPQIDNRSFIGSSYWYWPSMAFSGVIIVDCTYKTCTHKYELLEIIGVISTNMSFNVVFAFLEREKEMDYA